MTIQTQLSERAGARLWQFVASRRTSPARIRELGLPEPNQLSRQGNIEYLWYEPRTWLCRTFESGDGTHASAPLPGLESSGLLVEITDAFTTLRLEGPGSLELLAAGCAMDVEGIPIGRLAVTTVHHIRVLLIRRGKESFELLVPMSYAGNLRQSLFS